MALAANPIGGAFGGRVLNVIPCTCSFGLMLTVGPPVGGTFIYQFGSSTLYKNYSPTTGNWVLGTTLGRSTCLVYAGTSCVSVGNGALIRKMGTSSAPFLDL